MDFNYKVRPDVERLPMGLLVLGMLANTMESLEGMAVFVRNCIMRWVYDLDTNLYVDDPIRCEAWVLQQVARQGAEPFLTSVFEVISEYKQQLTADLGGEDFKHLANQINELLRDVD